MKKYSKPSFIIIILFLFFANLSFSQNTSIKGLYKEGHRLFKLEHYRKALPFLEKVLEAEPNNAKVMFETGVCYLHRYSKEKGLDYILKAYALDSNASKYMHFWMGRAYHQNYKYDKAIAEYNIYKASLGKNDERRKEVEKHINQTNTARQLTQDPENYKVTNLGPTINTIFSEHSPVTSSNDSLLMFTSRRVETTGGKEDHDGEFFEDIYQARKLPNGEWTKPEKIQLNTSGHDASIQLLDNDTKLLIYREAKGGDIFITELEQGTGRWKDPQKFGGINTGDFESDAYLTPDGKTAYVATNHYKKVGDLDIYYITKNDNGSWTRPKELRGKINTSEDEDAPFLSKDGKTLYFSSRGHKNMGGFDLFKSTLDSQGNWTAPVNLGFPINTPDDDVYYYISSNGKKSYMSSYREGGYGEKDLYDIVPIPVVNLVVKINPCQGKQREALTYSIKSQLKTTKKYALTGKVENDRFTGKVASHNTYRIAVLSGKDTIHAESFEIPFAEEENKFIVKNISLPCPEPQKDTNAIAAPSLRYIFRDIYFEQGKSELSFHAQRELHIAAEILKKNPGSEVTVKGAASAGDDPALAAKRVKVISDFLKGSGVIAVKEHQEHKTDASGIEGRTADIEVKLSKPLSLNFDPEVISPALVGPTYVLRNIYFETAKSDLNEEAKIELEILSEIMIDNPSLKVEVSGHTDTKGEDQLNLILSEKRAQSALDFLIAKGISKDRLISKGYGESKPIHNTEEDRKLNRRTEFRIIQ